MEEKSFEPECFTNINQMYMEFTSYLNELIKQIVPEKLHIIRIFLPDWYSSSTYFVVKFH